MAAAVIPGRYWDSNTFLGWLNREPAKVDLCEAVIDTAKAGQCRIVTSALTYAEVYWTKRGVKLSPEQQTEITDLFNYSWIVPVDLDRLTGERARQLMWDFPHIKSWDAVHLASAIGVRTLRHIDCFDTFDGDLINLTGKIANTDLKLAIPDLPSKHPLFSASVVNP
jgi:predicted nucleic acid-binding protein